MAQIFLWPNLYTSDVTLPLSSLFHHSPSWSPSLYLQVTLLSLSLPPCLAISLYQITMLSKPNRVWLVCLFLNGLRIEHGIWNCQGIGREWVYLYIIRTKSWLTNYNFDPSHCQSSISNAWDLTKLSVALSLPQHYNISFSHGKKSSLFSYSKILFKSYKHYRHYPIESVTSRSFFFQINKQFWEDRASRQWNDMILVCQHVKSWWTWWEMDTVVVKHDSKVYIIQYNKTWHYLDCQHM